MTYREHMHSLLWRVRELFGQQRIARELNDELQFHIDSEIAHNRAKGMSHADARRAALTAFGGLERYREEAANRRGFATIDALLRDVRLAFRRIKRAPLFAFGSIATLAVGLGIAAAIAALVYGVMLRPLPYSNPDELVRISIHTPGSGVTNIEQSAGTFVYIAERARSFALMGASMENEGVAITDGDAPERITVALLTPSLFRILGTRPAAGRLFRDEDALVQLDGPVLISYDVWQRRFGGDANIAGKTIELNRRSRVILGVLPAGFDFPSRAATVYYAERIEATRADLADRYLTVVARLAPGVTVLQAQSELSALIARIGERFPELTPLMISETGLSARVETLRGAFAAPLRAELLLLASMVAGLLIIAVANVATLSLLRAERMRGEVAVARALGATQLRIAQRFIVEGTVISLSGGLLALPVTTFAIALRFGLSNATIQRLDDVSLTPGLVLLLLAASLFIGVTLGVASAARAMSTRGGGGGTVLALRGAARTTQGRGWRRTQESLVAVQIALALSLLLATGLMTASLVKLKRIDIGFTPAHATKFSLALPFRSYPTYQRVAAFHLAVMEQLQRVPGVTSVGAAMQFPSTPQTLYSHPRVEATRLRGQTATALVNANVVSASFFRSMGIPLISGRAFVPGDLVSPAPGVVLGATLARQLFGSENPIGREVRIVSSTRYRSYRVVGVSGDVYSEQLAEGALRAMYFPLLGELPPTSTETEQRIPFMPAGMSFVVRSTAPLTTLTPEIRRAVASVDSRVPVWDVRTLDSIVRDSTARTRLSMLLLALGAAATLSLGVIGLYSVIAYAVAGRAREFAVRIAIGAAPREITRQVMREGALVAAIGVAAGVALSVASAGLLRDFLFEVSAANPLLYLAAIVVVLCSAAMATYAPARRASNIDPVQALRAE